MVTVENVEKNKLSDEEVFQKLKKRKEAVELSIKRKKAAIKEKKRKQRERYFIEKGKITEDLGLLEFELKTWAGLLLEVVDKLKNNVDEIGYKIEQWNEKGEHFLSLTPIERKEKALAIIKKEEIAGG